MAGNLARLRSLVLSAHADTLLVASTIFHCFPDPTAHQDITRPEVEAYINWMASSPYPAYGRVVGHVIEKREELVEVFMRLEPERYEDVADLVNAMSTADAAWDKSARASATNDLVRNTASAAQLAGHSAVEFVALESLVSAGYDNISLATTSIDLLRKTGFIDRMVDDGLQLRRSRRAVAASWVEEQTGVRRFFVSPWCLSKQACLALLAHYVREPNRARLEAVAVRRGQTALTYEARAGLQAVRAILEPAIAILHSHRYDPLQLAFVDRHGRRAYDIATRTKHVLVAFSYVHCRGSEDTLLELARVRSALAAPDITACREYAEFRDAEEVDETGLLVLFARTLLATRDHRDDIGFGDGYNKPPCLGLVMRARGDEERNTLACVARCQETVAYLRHREVDLGKQLLAVHWEGDLNPDVVIAAMAVSKVDIAVDIGTASVDIPGAAPIGASDSSYLVLLASAEARGLPRIIRLPYPTGLSISDRVELLYEFYTASGQGAVCYVGGGSPFSGKPSTQTCADANSVARALAPHVLSGALTFGTADFILPNLCAAHARRSEVAHAIECNGAFEYTCHNCVGFAHGLRDTVELVGMAGARLVKTRSAYAHNGNFSVELFGAGDPDFEDTVQTIETTAFMTAVRNADWEGELVIPERGDPYHRAFMDAMSVATRRAYDYLSGGEVLPVPEADLASVARSIT
ncbi:hypothetical protein [Penicillium digitatum polymycoviruses 1]|uniref:Uncharacterized protein n=1 Tax=Penicillium digitatum polymycoviruses 1 TaxID=2164101 RepID=A0A2R4SUG9_9VIRU|nr:hypothetical protein [Penicillium digitatum polymycoviruses 1]AVZ65984.1 hypothetical protein [Penicillium digitatum polymycoviruses 1]